MRYTLFVAVHVLFIGFWASLYAHAHDHARPDFDRWYQSLEQPNSHGAYGFRGAISCCNKQDCHETDAEIRGEDWWARLVVVQDGVEQKLDWIKVPPEKIIRNKENPTGSAVLCHTLSWNGKQIALDSITIYCFVPGVET